MKVSALGEDLPVNDMSRGAPCGAFLGMPAAVLSMPASPAQTSVRNSMQYKDPTFESVEVGETFGPQVIEMDEHYLRSACFALSDYSDCYTSADPAIGYRIVPSAALVRDGVALFLTKYNPNTVVGLHQSEELWYHAPVPFGGKVTLTGEYVDKYERRGKGYCVLDVSVHDESGRLMVRQKSTEIMRIPEGIRMGEGSSTPTEGRVSGTIPKNVSAVARASLDIAAGTPIPSLKKTAHNDEMAVFSGIHFDRHNIHTDDTVSSAAGFRARLAQGVQTTCWMSQMLADFFGPAAWFSSGWMKNVYLQPVYAGDELTAHGVVTGRTDDGRLELEVWTRNQDGLMTAAGWASAKVGG
jgi:acyl dehydratase